MVTHHHVDGAIQHAFSQGVPVAFGPEGRRHAQGADKPRQVFVAVHQMCGGGAACHLQSCAFGLANHGNALGTREGRKVKTASRVFQHVQVSRHPERLGLVWDANQSHLRAVHAFMHESARIHVTVEGNVDHHFAVNLAVGECALKEAHTVEWRVVGEGHRTGFAHVMHFRQLGALSPFRQTTQGQGFRRDSGVLCLGSQCEGVADRACMVDARGGARQHRNVGKTASACSIQAAVHALFGFQARLPEVGLTVNPSGADHASFGAQYEGVRCVQGRADVGHLSSL